MFALYDKNAIRKQLEKAAKRQGYKLDNLPKLSDAEGFAVACKKYSSITKHDLELIDRRVSISRASALTQIYR